MKATTLLLLLLPLGLWAQDGLRKDRKAAYNRYEINERKVFFAPPARDMEIKPVEDGITFSLAQQHVGITLLGDKIESDYYRYDASGDPPAELYEANDNGYLQTYYGDTLFQKTFTRNKLRKQLVKMKYRVNLSWEAVRAQPDLIGKEYVVWYVNFEGPSGLLEGVGTYPIEMDKEMGPKFQASLTSLYADSMENETIDTTFQLNLQGTGLSQSASGVSFSTTSVVYNDDVSDDSYNNYTYNYYPANYLDTAGNLDLAAILEKNWAFDPSAPDVEMTVGESDINVCNPDFITARNNDALDLLKSKLGSRATVSAITHRTQNGMDVYEAEGSTYGKGKLMATGYMAVFFTKSKYYTLHGYAVTDPAKWQQSFKKAAQSLTTTVKKGH